MVWDVNIIDEKGILVSAARCTVEIVDRPASDLAQLESQLISMKEWDSFNDLPNFW
jgi:hypothetical protein